MGKSLFISRSSFASHVNTSPDLVCIQITWNGRYLLLNWDRCSNLANTASLLWHGYKSLPSPSKEVNWAGAPPFSTLSTRHCLSFSAPPFNLIFPLSSSPLCLKQPNNPLQDSTSSTTPPLPLKIKTKTKNKNSSSSAPFKAK